MRVGASDLGPDWADGAGAACGRAAGSHIDRRVIRRPIVVFLPTLRGGGAERNMLRLAGALVDAGEPVTVVVADARGPYRPQVPSGAAFVDLGVRFLPTSVLPMRRWLRAHPPAVVLSAINGANVVALVARRLARVDTPIVVSERNTLSRWRADGWSVQRRWLIPWLVRWTYRQADAITAVSDATARDLAAFLKVSPDRIRVVPNPVVDADLERLASEPLDDEDEQRLGDGPVILTVGRLVSQKDPETLLSAFAIVRAAHPDAKLIVLGDGPLRDAAERFGTEIGLEGAVAFVGFRSNPYPWMRRADVVVLASRYEGLPTVLIEALACGAAIVATDSPGGSSEILEAGRWGRLVPVGDVRALAGAITEQVDAGRWVHHPDAAIDRYRVDRVVREYLAIIEDVRRL